MADININVPILARVEGEGALELKISQGKIERLQLRIYEPPRLFEKFLEGRSYDEVLDFVARICGICPVAYQMTATQALENICNIKPNHWLRQMRRLFYCGEWIESHSIHIHFLAAPDYFGYHSATEMAKDFPEEIRRGLRLQAIGNDIIKFLGARSVHPVGAQVGGFYHAPSINAAKILLQKLQENIKDAEALIDWTAALPFPEENQDFICVALQHPNEYAIYEGKIVSNHGLNISIEEFENYFYEYQVPYSNALHCKLQEKSYLVGPLARINLNYQSLPAAIRNRVAATSINFPSRNMYHSIVARAVEICFACHEAIRILENYILPEKSRLEVTPTAGVGFGCTEAPRGLLWHRYELDGNGMVKSARIVPPTSQNQARIEEDLYVSLSRKGLDRNKDELRKHSEMIIRNYDPCISCSTHFLDLRLQRA